MGYDDHKKSHPKAAFYFWYLECLKDYSCKPSPIFDISFLTSRLGYASTEEEL